MDGSESNGCGSARSFFVKEDLGVAVNHDAASSGRAERAHVQAYTFFLSVHAHWQQYVHFFSVCVIACQRSEGKKGK